MMKNSPLRVCISLVFSVFLGLIVQAQPLITASFVTPGNTEVMSEDCSGPYQLIINRAPGNMDTTVITFGSSGEAIPGVDFSLPPGTFPITLLPGQNQVVIDITIINDGLPEGGVPGFEELTLELSYTDGTNAGILVISSAIVDAYEIHLNISGDTIETCEYGIFVQFVEFGTSWESTGIAFWNPALVTSSGWHYIEVGNDTCGAKDSVYVELLYGNILEDTLYVCNDGPGVQINTLVTGDPIAFQWIPSDSTLSDTNSLTPTAKPGITTTYILEVEFAECTSRDTVVVRVDSLPDDLHINIAPAKPYYCAGEIVALFSPSFDSLAYPDLTFLWRPNDGTFLSDVTLLNAALQLEDTTLYIRDNINNACLSHDSIMINVVPAGVPLSVTDTTLCPGETFEVSVLSNQVTEPEWTPADGLSCTNCLSPTVTVIGEPGTTFVYNFSGKILECPVGASLSIRIPRIQEIIISGNTSICENGEVPLTILNAANLSDITWNVVSGGATLSCNDCLNPVVTATNLPIVLNVSASTTDTAYCGAAGTFSITEGEIVQFVGPDVFACDEETAQIGPVNPAYTNLEWSVFDGSIDLSCNNCPNPIITLHEDGTLVLNADYASGDTCHVIIRYPIKSFIPDDANIVIEPPMDTILQGSQVLLQLNNSQGNPASIVWTVNGTMVPGSGITLSFNANEEINEVTATFINSKGCEQTETLTFTTIPPSYKIPNAFTPNGDMLNDNFRIIITGDIHIQEFLIFNRWGQLVYEAPEDDLAGWNGSFKGEAASSDTYVYTATLQFPDRIEVVKGDVMLIR